MNDTSFPGDHQPDLVPPTIGPSTGGNAGGPSGDLVGTVLAGRYRILRKLGEGAMGAVYLGEHLKIGRQDAIKVLVDSLATDPEVIARFLRGTRNVSLIRHPNICTLYDFSDTEAGTQFVAMEYVPGETLKDLLQREGLLPLPRAIHIAKQVADALQAAHEAGIVHRDLKPANIMVVQGRRGEDQIKVVDFDIAKGSTDGEEEEVTRMGFVVGTPEYMSPEQLIGERLDGRSDIYSTALVLFRMLTGTLPFRADGMQDLMIKRLTDEPLRLSEALPGVAFPEPLERALRQALSRKPADRQASAEEFGLQITEAIAGTLPAPPGELPGRAAPDSSTPVTRFTPAATVASGTAAGSTPPGQPAAHERGSRTVVIAGAAGALLVASVAAGFFLVNGDPEPTAPAALEQRVPPELAVGPAAAEKSGEVVTSGTSSEAVAYSGSATEIPKTSSSAPAAVEPATPAARPTATPPRSAGAPAWLTTAAVEPVLDNLFDRIGPPYPPRAVLEATRDSALAIASWGQATTKQRAFAAHILGSALIGLDDTGEGVRWLARAVELDPNNRGYRTLLDAYRR